MQRVTLALDRITARAGNRAAGGFDEAQLAELSESIKRQGLLQPLLVTPTDMPGRRIARTVPPLPVGAALARRERVLQGWETVQRNRIARRRCARVSYW